MAHGPVGAGGGQGETGMVTAETALVLPVLVLVLAIALGALRFGLDQVRCLDAARAAARAAARGDSPAAVSDLARRGAPDGAATSVEVTGDLVTVRVVGPPPPSALLAGLPRPVATVTAQREEPEGGP